VNNFLPDLSTDNICQNRLTISGSFNDINKFIEDNKSANGKFSISLSQSVPIPDHYKGEYAQIWAEENWGMNKDIDKVYNHFAWYKNGIYNTRSISFASHGMPVYPWLFNVAPLYLNISFELEFIDMANHRYGKFIIADRKFTDVNLNHKLEKAFKLVEKYHQAFGDIKPTHLRDENIWKYIKNTKYNDLLLFLEENNEVSRYVEGLDAKS
jgi:hypothetical protein